MQWLQDPTQRNKCNLNNARREASRHFKNKRSNNQNIKFMNLKLTVRISGASVTLRRVTGLELIEKR
jgi:hypothetical protein